MKSLKKMLNTINSLEEIMKAHKNYLKNKSDKNRTKLGDLLTDFSSTKGIDYKKLLSNTKSELYNEIKRLEKSSSLQNNIKDYYKNVRIGAIIGMLIFASAIALTIASLIAAPIPMLLATLAIIAPVHFLAGVVLIALASLSLRVGFGVAEINMSVFSEFSFKDFISLLWTPIEKFREQLLSDCEEFKASYENENEIESESEIISTTYLLKNSTNDSSVSNTETRTLTSGPQSSSRFFNSQGSSSEDLLQESEYVLSAGL